MDETQIVRGVSFAGITFSLGQLLIRSRDESGLRKQLKSLVQLHTGLELKNTLQKRLMREIAMNMSYDGGKKQFTSLTKQNTTLFLEKVNRFKLFGQTKEEALDEINQRIASVFPESVNKSDLTDDEKQEIYKAMAAIIGIEKKLKGQ